VGLGGDDTDSGKVYVYSMNVMGRDVIWKNKHVLAEDDNRAGWKL
jgi:hypothetical protein